MAGKDMNLNSHTMQTRQLWAVLIVAFIDLLGFSLIVPIIPFYAEQFGASPFLVGLLVASYAAAQVLGAPLIGRFSDRYGRRPALLITICCNAIGLSFSDWRMPCHCSLPDESCRASAGGISQWRKRISRTSPMHKIVRAVWA